MTYGRVPSDIRALYYLLLRIEPKKDLDAMWVTHGYIEKIDRNPGRMIQVYKWNAQLRMQLAEHILKDLP